MQENVSYDYTIIRVVPNVDRGECINCGVVLYCQSRKFLGSLIHLDLDRLRALDPEIDFESVEEHLAAIPKICSGDKSYGEVAGLSLSARFNWLAAPKSAIIQMSPIHSGVCRDPESALRHLLDSMVLRRHHPSRQQRDPGTAVAK